MLNTIRIFLFFISIFLLAACQSESKKTSSDKDQPLMVCNLTSKQLQEREEYLRKEVFSKLDQTIELEDGYEFIFKQPIDYSITLTEFINFERKCCPGLTYTLTFEPEEGPIHLKIGNSKEIKEALKAELDNLTH